ncbi:MAG: response regulator [Deltaproteobacteria bacterium]|nr:response regulator [Deltaproteobacteria bacterium]MBN2674472.1 response regulator [Deltaproteobacteria bacterium]
MAKTIMTADDSASMRQMITFTLKQAGYDVIEAEDGQDALKKAETANIDMLITDLNMPNMNGLELIEAIRGKDKYKFIPIIMLTTESDAEKKKQGKNAGATGWLVKPFQPPQLISVIKKVLR